jgi:hypothetical protein
MAEETKLKTHTLVQLLYQDIVKARTNYEFQAAVDDAAAPVNYDKNQQHSYVFIRKGLFLK